LYPRSSILRLEVRLIGYIVSGQQNKYSNPASFNYQYQNNVSVSLLSAAGIQAAATLHKFRHTYATLLILRGVPIQNIKELLGHSSVVQTEIYAHNKSDHSYPDVSKLDNLLN
jgi:integrase